MIDSGGAALPKQFWRLMIGYLMSAFGDGVYLIAINWWVVTSTGSAAAVGIVSAAGAITFIVLAPVSGRLIDRLGVMRLLIAADAWRALVLGGFLVLGSVGFDQAGIGFFVPLMVLMSIGTSVGQPGIFALIPALVPIQNVGRANSVLATGRSLAVILGPAVSGVMLGFAGVGPSAIVNVATFIVSAGVLWSIRSNVPESARKGRAREPVKQSTFRLIVGSRATISAFLVALVGNLVLSMYTVTLPLKFSISTDKAGPTSITYGLTQASFQVGMFIIGILLAREWAARIPTTSRKIAIGLACMGVAMSGVGYLNFIPFLLLLASFVGGSLMFVSVLSDPQLQLKIPESHRGSVQGLVQGLGSGLRPIGILMATFLFSVGGAGLALVVASALVLTTAFLLLILDGYRDALNSDLTDG